MENETLKDAKGNILGRIRGYYDATTDHTRGPDKRILAKGNLLSTLIC